MTETNWNVGYSVVQTPSGELDVIISYLTGEWPDETRKKWRKLSFLSLTLKDDCSYDAGSMDLVEEQIVSKLSVDDNGVLLAKKTFLGDRVMTEFMIYSTPSFGTNSLFQEIVEKHPEYERKTAFDIDRYWTIYDKLVNQVSA